VSGCAYNDLRSVDIQPYLAVKDISVSQGAASDYSFKILIIGDAGVGKSCILTRFSESVFKEDLSPTIGIDFNSRQVKVEGAICKLEIWDTAGQERFSTITASYYRNAQGALLVYDIGRMESFLSVKKWFERARLLGGEFIEAVLVGNKSDISMSARQVSCDQGRTLASDLGIPFVETSAKEGNGVDQAFVSMAANIKKSVDRRGLAGVSKSSLEQAGCVVISDGDKKSMSQKCC
jgi:small GTP-binding protein